MNKKIIPTAMLDEHSVNIGIDKMTVRYTQQPDCNDPDQQPQFLTVEAVGYDDGDEESVMKGEQGYYLVLSTERWAINNPNEMEMVLNDFFNRLKATSESALKAHPSEDEALERYIALNNQSQDEATHMADIEFKMGAVPYKRGEINLDPLEDVVFDEEPAAEEPEPKLKKTPKSPKAVDVLVDGEWVTFASVNKAAKALGVSPAWLAKSLQLGKTCNGRPVRYSNPELDACLSEIEARKKEPYQTSPKP